ncbi:MAG: mycofactocin precursor MftA [SAR324 cluster bacterium]|nr:mycofactocin precursor MftA [SAR324 cluster bacterium]
MDKPVRQEAENTSAAQATRIAPRGKQGAPRGKLDLSGLEPPADLSECSIEEVTIDGICGVY